MFKKIVVAVDGSENAERALEMAADMALAYGGSLTVVNAYEPVPDWLGNAPMQARIAEQISRSEHLLEHAARRLADRGVAEIELNALEGPPATAIVNAAASRSADLIIVGSRGLTPMRGLLLGSVSERVLGLASCPVLVVR
jgi:nucleotide-binding universal stress UspA family protein